MRREPGGRRVYRSRAVRRRRGLLAAFIIIGAATVLAVAGTSGSRDLVKYDRAAAAKYADAWALSDNPAYWVSADNDCANFVSQCVAAGGLRPTAGSGLDWHANGGDFPTVGWVNVDRQWAAWSAAADGQSSPYIVQSSAHRPRGWAAGDVVYLGNTVNGAREWQHVIICVGREHGEWVYDSHTVAHRRQPMETWYPAHFSLIRYCRLADSVAYR